VSSITYIFRKIDLIEFNEHHAKMNTAYGKSITRHKFIWPSVMAVMALFFVISLGDIALGLITITVAVLWGALVSTWIKKKFSKRLMGSISDDDVANLLGEYTIELTETGLLETKPVGELQVTWGDIVKLEKSKSHLYIYLTEDSAIIIPKKTLADQKSLKPFYNELIKALKAHQLQNS